MEDVTSKGGVVFIKSTIYKNKKITFEGKEWVWKHNLPWVCVALLQNKKNKLIDKFKLEIISRKGSKLVNVQEWADKVSDQVKLIQNSEKEKTK